MKRNECMAMLLAGGQGSRLYCLTSEIAKPGLSFGGKYRIIDFSLSNCSNSGIDTVGVLTQYKPFLLNTYMGIGTAWDFDTDYGGMHVLPPYMDENGGTWYKGTANAIYQNINFIDLYSPKYIAILSGDHIYKMDYSKMLDEHKAKKADVTIAVIDVSVEEASRFGIMNCDEDNKIISFEEKPKVPKSTLASMGIYIFSWDVLRKALIEDEADPNSENDFGKNIIPNLLNEEKSLFAYNFKGYWKDVGTIPSYYEANMELLSDNPPLDIYEKHFKISSNSSIYPSQYIGEKAVVKSSLISNGCTILGEVQGSILGAGVTIGEGCIVKNSILLPGSTVRAGSIVEKSILGENCDVLEGCHLGVIKGKSSAHAGITVVANNYVVPHGSKIIAGSEVKNLK